MRIVFFFLILLSSHALLAQFDAKQTGGNGFEEKLDFQLYPNPMSGNVLHIKTDEHEMMEINIINILGEVVFQTATYEHQIHPNNLKSGIFIVKIKQGAKSGLSRLVVP